MAIAALTLAFLTALPPQEAPGELETWNELAEEYELTFMAWAQEQSRSGAWTRPEAERPPSPAAELWPRFEALARAGEGRAVVWMLQNAHVRNSQGTEWLRDALELVRAAGPAGWVADALPPLARNNAGIRDELQDYLRGLHEPGPEGTPVELRLAALLAHATLVAESTPEQAADLRQRAAFLRWREVDLAPGEEVLPEDLFEIAAEAVEQVQEDDGAWFQEAYREGDDGVYYPRAAPPASPKDTWRPVLEVLAERGATPARTWVLFNTWPRDEREREMLRTHLDVLSREGLEPDQLRQLAYRVSSLSSALGAEFVETRVRALIDGAPEEQRPALYFGLGDGLCETANQDGAQRERGLALLREVGERWPDSPEAERASGKLFRHENLVVGKPCPDFEAVDTDGNAFKLSDYEGKVTVIDFWGFW